MRGSKHTEEQIIAILKQAENGVKTAELCRQHGISEQTLYRWKGKYGGLEGSDSRKLRQLEEENRKLKSVVAELTLDNRALKDVLSKNVWSASELQEAGIGISLPKCIRPVVGRAPGHNEKSARALPL